MDSETRQYRTGDREGAMRELRRAHEVLAHIGAQRELDATREQLLHQLQEWCKRAEESGIHALQEFAVRLRRYA